MREVPARIRDSLLNLMVEGRDVAWLELDADGRVRSAGGALREFGVCAGPGEQVLGQAAFLVGLLPKDHASVHVPRVQTESGRFADVHAVASDAGVTVLLVDASVQVERLAHVQQWANELNLDRRPSATRGRPVHRARRVVLTAAMFRVRIAVGSEPEIDDPERAMRERERVLRTVVAASMDFGGLVHRQSVTETLVLFGVQPTDGNMAEQAVGAAQRACERVCANSRYTVSAGISAGPAVIGSSTIRAGSRPAVFGAAVDRAIELSALAAAGEIRVDDAIRQMCGVDSIQFRASGSPDSMALEP